MKFILITLLFCLSNGIKSQHTEYLNDFFNKAKCSESIKEVIFKRLKETNLVVSNIEYRSKINKGFNIIVITPQCNINNNIIVFDSTASINRVILFNKNKIIASLLFTKNMNTVFCPTKMDINTCFDCGKYIFREKNYVKSLQILLKSQKYSIFKSSDFERVWFYIDNNEVWVLTYDLEKLTLNDFFNRNDLEKYLIPDSYITN